MKMNFIAAAVLVSAIAAPALVSAADGQVNFGGSIIDSACTVTNTPSNPLRVVLGNFARASFAKAGDKSGLTAFNVQLTNCPVTVTTAAVKFDGTALNGDNNVLALTQDSGVATGVGIELSDKSNTVLPLYTASTSYALQSGSAVNNLDFAARYVATTATVTSGPANSVASFTVNYN